MKRRNKIIYWIATAWLSLGMLSTGIVQIIQTQAEIQKMTSLGYPDYLLTIMGVWKISGVLVLLIPGFALIKEWAYAGFFIAMSGAIISHLIIGSDAKEIFGPTLLLLLTIISWYMRPPERKLNFNSALPGSHYRVGQINEGVNLTQ